MTRVIVVDTRGVRYLLAVSDAKRVERDGPEAVDSAWWVEVQNDTAERTWLRGSHIRTVAVEEP